MAGKNRGGEKRLHGDHKNEVRKGAPFPCKGQWPGREREHADFEKQAKTCEKEVAEQQGEGPEPQRGWGGSCWPVQGWTLPLICVLSQACWLREVPLLPERVASPCTLHSPPPAPGLPLEFSSEPQPAALCALLSVTQLRWRWAAPPVALRLFSSSWVFSASSPSPWPQVKLVNTSVLLAPALGARFPPAPLWSPHPLTPIQGCQPNVWSP